MFSKMLLDALQKAPPASLHDLRVFFDRSRARLEHSLDKGGVSGQAREDYLDQFEAGVDEAQRSFLNAALAQRGAEDSSGTAQRAWHRLPMVWALLAFALVAGVMIGVLLAP